MVRLGLIGNPFNHVTSVFIVNSEKVGDINQNVLLNNILKFTIPSFVNLALNKRNIDVNKRH